MAILEGAPDLRSLEWKRGMMAKYQPLHDWLVSAPRGIEVGFAEISALVGGLPTTAYRRREWWSNNPTHHVQGVAWLGAGRRVSWVDLELQRVRFE